MKHIPNIITVLRFVGSASLLLCNLAGLLLFIAVPTVFWSFGPIAIVAAVATFAAIQEGHLIRKMCFIDQVSR